MKIATIVTLLVISIAMGFTLWAFSSSMTPYVNIQTALKSAGDVQVRGKILHNTVQWNSQLKALTFTLLDPHNQSIEVVYKGPKPESFDTAPETAVTGSIQNLNGKRVFVSTSMVVKCPSKYDDSKKIKQVYGGGGG